LRRLNPLNSLLEALASFLNLQSRNEFVLIVAWLLAALRFGGPHPLLAISGELKNRPLEAAQIID
jgi:hypothetical protein